MSWVPSPAITRAWLRACAEQAQRHQELSTQERNEAMRALHELDEKRHNGELEDWL